MTTTCDPFSPNPLFLSASEKENLEKNFKLKNYQHQPPGNQMAESNRTAKESGTKQAMNDTRNSNHGLIAKQLFLYQRTYRVRNLKVPTLPPTLLKLALSTHIKNIKKLQVYLWH